MKIFKLDDAEKGKNVRNWYTRMRNIFNKTGYSKLYNQQRGNLPNILKKIRKKYILEDKRSILNSSYNPMCKSIKGLQAYKCEDYMYSISTANKHDKKHSAAQTSWKCRSSFK